MNSDLPHSNASHECWYINGHVTSNTNQQTYSIYAMWQREMTHVGHTGEYHYLHYLSYGIVDIHNNKYYYDTLMEPTTPMILTHAIQSGEYPIDYRLKRAFLEMTHANQIPLPDRMMTSMASISHDTLDINYDDRKLWKDENGNYHVNIQYNQQGIGMDIVLTPQKNVVQGYQSKLDNTSHSFIPRTTITGALTINNIPHDITGQGWYDHEYSGNQPHPSKILTCEQEQEYMKEFMARMEGTYKPKVSLDALKLTPTGLHGSTDADDSHPTPSSNSSLAHHWTSIQLSNGMDITTTTWINPKTNEIIENVAIIVDQDGNTKQYNDVILKGSNPWVSVRTTSTYYLHYDLDIPSANIHLQLDADISRQESITLTAKPAFWEGRMKVTGTINNDSITGLAFLERYGFSSLDSLGTFFKTISKQVMYEMDRALPRNPTDEQFRYLIANDEFSGTTYYANKQVFADKVIAPLREIIDRGGKSWRSYCLLLCMDVVGGDSEVLRHWLVMPEIIHVGSLIVDDIQDKSEERRGGKAAHLMYGDDLAINAGTYAYFIAVSIIQHFTPWMSMELKLRLNEIVSVILRAGHAGQAFDIHGLYYLMPEAVKTGDPRHELEEHVICTHRLKSAIPACGVAKIGAAAGNATPEQTKLLGEYFEAIGISFQIIDDVLNLRGTLGKTLGEDITAGKITFPIAMAMQRLSNEEERQQLWTTLQSKPSDPEIVAKTIALLESCGSIDACIEKADKLVNDAWAKLDGVLPPSLYKMQLRAFGFYILQQVY